MLVEWIFESMYNKPNRKSVIYKEKKKKEIQHSIHTKSNKWNQNVINFLVRQKCMFSKIYILYIIIYVYKSFSTTLDKGLSKNIKKKIRDGFGRMALKHVKYYV